MSRLFVSQKHPLSFLKKLCQCVIHEETSVNEAKEGFGELLMLVLHNFLVHFSVLALAVDYGPGELTKTKHARLVPPFFVNLGSIKIKNDKESGVLRVHTGDFIINLYLSEFTEVFDFLHEVL